MSTTCIDQSQSSGLFSTRLMPPKALVDRNASSRTAHRKAMEVVSS